MRITADYHRTIREYLCATYFYPRFEIKRKNFIINMERRENRRKFVRINEDATMIYSIIPNYKIKERGFLRIRGDKEDDAISHIVTPNYKRGRNLTKDLGIGGIRFFSNSFIPLNSILKVEIKLKYVPKVINAIVELVWIKGIFDDESYEVGAKFIDINKEDLFFLNSYLSSRS